MRPVLGIIIPMHARKRSEELTLLAMVLQSGWEVVELRNVAGRAARRQAKVHAAQAPQHNSKRAARMLKVHCCDSTSCPAYLNRCSLYLRPPAARAHELVSEAAVPGGRLSAPQLAW